MPTDARGFEQFAEFTDTYDHRVRVKLSSAAVSPHVWIFLEHEADGSAHLNLAQAQFVIDALQKFLDDSGNPKYDGYYLDEKVDWK